MNNIFKNKAYLTILAGLIISITSLLSIFLISNKTYYTILFAANILFSFFTITFILLTNHINKNTMKFKYISLYLLMTLSFLLVDIIVMSYRLNLSIYSNLMYLSNIQLYFGIYSIFVLFMTIISIYALIKDKKND